MKKYWKFITFLVLVCCIMAIPVSANGANVQPSTVNEIRTLLNQAIEKLDNLEMAETPPPSVPQSLRYFESYTELRNWMTEKEPEIRVIQGESAKMLALQDMALSEGYIWNLSTFGITSQYDPSLQRYVVKFPASMVFTGDSAYLVRVDGYDRPIIRLIGKIAR